MKFLIERGFVDNEDDQSETVHRFLEIYEQFEGEADVHAAAISDSIDGGPGATEPGFSADPFETRALFTLADFLKSLGPNEYYDIAQKVFNSWEDAHSGAGPAGEA